MFRQLINLCLELDILLNKSLLLVVFRQHFRQLVWRLLIRRLLLLLWVLVLAVGIVEILVALLQRCRWLIVVLVLIWILQKLIVAMFLIYLYSQICLNIGLEVLVHHLHIKLLALVAHFLLFLSHLFHSPIKYFYNSFTFILYYFVTLLLLSSNFCTLLCYFVIIMK